MYEKLYKECPKEIQIKIMYHIALKGRAQARSVMMWYEFLNLRKPLKYFN